MPTRTAQYPARPGADAHSNARLPTPTRCGCLPDPPTALPHPVGTIASEISCFILIFYPFP